jgi:uncharacterized protein (TIGR02466 family)
MNLTYWFPTVLGESNMPNAQEEYIKLKPHIEKIVSKSKKCFNYYPIHKDKKFKRINEFVLKEVTEYAKAHSFDEPKIQESWFNNYGPGDLNDPHTHAGSHLTAVFYLVGQLDDTALLIYSPVPTDMSNPSKKTVINPHNKSNPFTSETCIIKPSTGFLCIFRSFLIHQVPTKMSDAPRISLTYTFNV